MMPMEEFPTKDKERGRRATWGRRVTHHHVGALALGEGEGTTETFLGLRMNERSHE